MKEHGTLWKKNTLCKKEQIQKFKVVARLSCEEKRSEQLKHRWKSDLRNMQVSDK